MLQKALLCVVVICQMVIGDSFEGTGYCYTEYVHVSVVKQVPSYSKHCTKVRLLQNYKITKVFGH